MATLIDLHNHALFGVDDGAQTIEACMQMLQASYSGGVRAICFTPHYNPSSYRTTAEDVYATYEKVCAIASRRFPDLALLLGNEVYAYPDSVAALEDGRCRPLGNGRMVLVEFSPCIGYRDMRNRFLAYFTAGYHPVLAHAERYTCLYQDMSRVKELVDMRVIIQVNAEPVLRFSHLRTYRFVHGLLSARLVHVVASDMHDVQGVASLPRAYGRISRRYGEAYAKQLFYINPKRILLRKQGEE
ncbi:MAG: hypothetical protein IJ009_04410 [Clostridia bacterium]|nr:hypothetical protein [Clostridia bacterium]